MADIITELRERSLRAEQDGEPMALLDEAAAEIERLRQRDVELLAAGDRLESQLAQVARERAHPRLTDAEREAVSHAYDILCQHSVQLQVGGNIPASRPFVRSAKALQGLWERLGGSE